MVLATIAAATIATFAPPTVPLHRVATATTTAQRVLAAAITTIARQVPAAATITIHAPPVRHREAVAAAVAAMVEALHHAAVVAVTVAEAAAAVVADTAAEAIAGAVAEDNL